MGTYDTSAGSQASLKGETWFGAYRVTSNPLAEWWVDYVPRVNLPGLRCWRVAICLNPEDAMQIAKLLDSEEQVPEGFLKARMEVRS